LRTDKSALVIYSLLLPITYLQGLLIVQINSRPIEEEYPTIGGGGGLFLWIYHSYLD